MYIFRVVNGNFSLIMEKPAARYISEDECNLTTKLEFSIDEVDNMYAFGISKNLPDDMVNDINDALKHLLDDGFILDLQEKWWRGKCSVSSATAISFLKWIYASSTITALFLRGFL